VEEEPEEEEGREEGAKGSPDSWALACSQKRHIVREGETEGGRACGGWWWWWRRRRRKGGWSLCVLLLLCH